MPKSLLFSLLLSLALLLTLSTRAVFAQGDDQDEPIVDVQLDEEGDLARGPGEEGSGADSGNSGENQAEGGRPPMSPEETEAVSLSSLTTNDLFVNYTLTISFYFTHYPFFFIYFNNRRHKRRNSK